MTGKELIIYILKNNLENEEVFKDGKIIGFLTIEEAAAKWGVGVETIRMWNSMSIIDGISIGKTIYVPKNATLNFTKGK
jgi:hypothetical protein